MTFSLHTRRRDRITAVHLLNALRSSSELNGEVEFCGGFRWKQVGIGAEMAWSSAVFKA